MLISLETSSINRSILKFTTRLTTDHSGLFSFMQICNIRLLPGTCSFLSACLRVKVVRTCQTLAKIKIVANEVCRFYIFHRMV